MIVSKARTLEGFIKKSFRSGQDSNLYESQTYLKTAPYISASYAGEQPIDRERVVPRDPVERFPLRNRFEPAEEPALCVRRRCAQVARKPDSNKSNRGHLE